METEAIETLIKIIENLENALLCKKQDASISMVAINIAASPPNNKNVKKTMESEKFNIYFDLGKVRLILVAIKIVEAKSSANVHEKISSFKQKKANVKHKMPKTAIKIL